MKKATNVTTPFHFKDDIYVYSVERLIILCKDLYDDGKCNEINQAYKNIDNGNLEEWLDSIGEPKLCAIVNEIKKENRSQVYPVRIKLKNIYQELSKELKIRNFFELLDIDNAIEITFKEYDTLRSEILQNISEVSQIILLGLAAIFTIASLALAPLAGFLTEEDTIIEIPLTLEQTAGAISKDDLKLFNDIKVIKEGFNKQLNFDDLKKQAQNKIKTEIEKDPKFSQVQEKELESQLKNAKVIIVGTLDDVQYRLRIKKSTNGETIEERGIIPSVVIFNWLIPSLSLYLIYRLLYSIQKNKMLGRYIFYRIEQKLIQLSKIKQQYLKINIQDIKNLYDVFAKYKIEGLLTHCAWENYLREDEKYLDPLDINLLVIVFNLISFISFIGGSLLLSFNFNSNKLIILPAISNNLLKQPIFNIICQFICIFILIRLVILFLVNYINNKSLLNFITISFLFATGLMILSRLFNSSEIVQSSLLLLFPYCIYAICIIFCLKRKDYIQQLAVFKKMNNEKPRKFTKIFAKVLDEMWDNSNKTESLTFLQFIISLPKILYKKIIK